MHISVSCCRRRACMIQWRPLHQSTHLCLALLLDMGQVLTACTALHRGWIGNSTFLIQATLLILLEWQEWPRYTCWTHIWWLDMYIGMCIVGVDVTFVFRHILSIPSDIPVACAHSSIPCPMVSNIYCHIIFHTLMLHVAGERITFPGVSPTHTLNTQQCGQQQILPQPRDNGHGMQAHGMFFIYHICFWANVHKHR